MMTGNPIIHRELLSSLRAGKALLMQIAFLLVTGALVLLHWPDGGFQDIDGQEARNIFGIIAIGELVMVILFAPAFTASALTLERERNTIESLFATSMKPWEIAAGKIVGSLGFLLLIVLTGVPALALPFLLGGIEGGQLLAAVGILMLTAIYLGMIGLLVSSVMHRSYRAIIVTYALLLFICFLMAMPATPLSGSTVPLVQRPAEPALRGALHVLASLSPLEAMISLVWPGHDWATGTHGMPAYWMLYLPLATVVTVAATAVCLYKLHRPIAPPRPRERLLVVERGKITARTFMFVVDPRKRKRAVQWWQNPILVKEFRTRPMLQTQWLLRAVGWSVIIAVLLMLAQAFVLKAGMSDRPSTLLVEQDLPVVIATLAVVIILLVGPAMTGGTLCTDRETGVWDLIRVTPLSSWRIVSGKLQAAVIPLLLLVMAIVPTLVMLPMIVSFHVNIWPTILRILAVVLMTALFVATAGMFFSGIFSRTATATAWTYALVVSLGLLTLLMLIGEGRFSERMISSVFVASPLAAALDAAGHPTMRRYGLFLPHLKVMGAATAIMFLVSIVRVVQLRRPDK